MRRLGHPVRAISDDALEQGFLGAPGLDQVAMIEPCLHLHTTTSQITPLSSAPSCAAALSTLTTASLAPRTIGYGERPGAPRT